MTEDIMARVYEPFFTTEEPGKGDGLGLSQNEGVARDYGGHIQLVSARGQGTEATLWLPVATEPAARASVAASSASSRSPGLA